jgi:hypothetical protein
MEVEGMAGFEATLRLHHTDAVIRVGDGRGFIIAHDDQRLVVTAAHCLPRIPEPMPARHLWECTFLNLLGALDEEPTITVECLFADVIADIAVLGAPDSQECHKECDAYEAFMESRPALVMGDIPLTDSMQLDLPRTPVWLLRLDGQWARANALRFRKSISLEDGTLTGGMSGSPIMAEDGSAIGIVSTDMISPCLVRDLPGWICPGRVP